MSRSPVTFDDVCASNARVDASAMYMYDLETLDAGRKSESPNALSFRGFDQLFTRTLSASETSHEGSFRKASVTRTQSFS